MKSRIKYFKCYAKASAAETNLQNEEANFYQTLTQNYSQQFANQSAILQSLQSAFSPILAAGPGQFGYSPQETTDLRSQATDATGNTFAEAQTALNEKEAAAGGGNVALPSGAQKQLNEQLATSTAQEQSAQNLGITQAGYQQGLSNFMAAANILGSTASQYNPLGYAGASTNANSTAFGEANTIQQQNSAWEGEVGGILGGAAGSLLGNPQLGSILGSGGGGQTSPILTNSLTTTPTGPWTGPVTF